MALTRRGFLTALLGTVAAVRLFPQLARADVAVVDVADEAWESIYAQAHRRAFQCFEREMLARGVVVPREVMPENVIGDRLPNGALITTAQGVDVRDSDVLDDGTIESAMVCLADYAQIDQFAGPSVPRGIEYGAACGALRMVVVYDGLADERLVRFDVIGAQSAAYRRVREQRRQSQLARTIKRRLMVRRRVLPLPA